MPARICRSHAYLLAASLMTAGAAAGCADRPVDSGPMWRGEWFANADLQSPAVHSMYVERIDFNWGADAPHARVPSDNFSARFDTCLDLDRPRRLAFHLASDDGARLLVNGATVVDNWGTHAWGTTTGGLVLPAGRHHLRLDYFDGGNDAALQLIANPPILEPPHLTPPAQPFDRNNPCRLAR